MVVVGQREAEQGLVSIRHRELDVVGTMPVETFVEAVCAEFDARLIKPALEPEEKETPQQ